MEFSIQEYFDYLICWRSRSSSLKWSFSRSHLASHLVPFNDCLLKIKNFFFFNFLLDTCPFLGPLIPLFQTSGDASSGFQSQSGFCLIRTLQSVVDICSVRFTSGATPLQVYMVHSSQSSSATSKQRWDAGFEPRTSCSLVWRGTHSATATGSKIFWF